MKMIRAFAILLLFVILSAIHLAIYTNSTNTGFKIDEQKKDLEKLRSENRNLNYLVAKDSALPRIENIAKGKLNMVYPEKVNYIIVATKEAKPLE